MLPNQLAKIVDSVDYIDYEFRIRKVNLSTDLLKVEFGIHDTEGSGEDIVVVMTLEDMADYFITKNNYSGYINLETDHPLLWRFSDTWCELYITGKTVKFKEVFYELFIIFHSLFGKYIPFDPGILNVLNNGHGLFMKGPKKLLKLYADKLNYYGIKTSIINELAADREDCNLKILFLGNSYFISKNFEFEILS